MKTIPHVAHPDVEYWRCPVGDARIFMPGDRFNAMAAMGLVIETTDLPEVLPLSVLEEAEALVEAHEQEHPGGAS